MAELPQKKITQTALPIAILLFLTLQVGIWIGSSSGEFLSAPWNGALFVIVFLGVLAAFWVNHQRSQEQKGTPSQQETDTLQTFEQTLPLFHLFKMGIMVLNTDGIICYLNDAAKTLCHDLAQWFPIPPEQLIGTPYHEFHYNLNGLQNYFEDPHVPAHETELDIGHEIISSCTVPVLNQDGQHTGSLVMWRVITRERNQEHWDKIVENQIQSASRELTTTCQELQALSQQMKYLAEHNTQATEVSNFAKQVSSHINELALSLEETSVTTKAIADQVSYNSQIAQKAFTEAQNTAQILADMNKMTNRVESMALQISEIMRFTHILAINASVEAAKAGKTGKGFAVVAREVQKLSRQTATVTREITNVTQQMLEQIPLSVQAIQEVQAVIQEMNRVSGSIDESMLQQTNRMREMSESMNFADENSQQIGSRMAQVVSHSEETNDQIAKGLGTAMEIIEVTTTFQTIANRFGDERVVTPSDVYRLMVILNYMFDALVKNQGMLADMNKLETMRAYTFEQKQPEDVLRKTFEVAKDFIALHHLPETTLPFPKGTVTPTQVYNFVSNFVEVVGDFLTQNTNISTDTLKNAIPVAGKTPSDVFGMIDLANRKLKLLNFSRQR